MLPVWVAITVGALAFVGFVTLAVLVGFAWLGVEDARRTRRENAYLARHSGRSQPSDTPRGATR